MAKIDSLIWKPSGSASARPRERGGGVSKSRKYAWLGAAALAALFAAAWLRPGLLPFTDQRPIHPSGASLEETFKQHEAAFDELIAMSNTDATVIRIGPDFTWLVSNASWPRPESELGFSKARWDEYRRAFEKLGLKEGLGRSSDGSFIELIASSQGVGGSGSGKGYV